MVSVAPKIAKPIVAREITPTYSFLPREGSNAPSCMTLSAEIIDPVSAYQIQAKQFMCTFIARRIMYLLEAEMWCDHDTDRRLPPVSSH